MKRIIFLLVVVLLFFVTPVLAAENNNRMDENIIFDQLEKMDLNRLQEEVEQINNRVHDKLPELNLKEILLGFIRGDLEVQWIKILQSLLQYLGQEVTANIKLLGQVIILAVLSAVLEVFHGSFSSKTISQTANLLIFLVLAVIILNSFQLAVQIGINSIDYMTSFMHALVPVLLTLLVSMGAITSAAIFHPITFLIISVLTTGIKNIIFPMIFISVILSIVNNLTDEFNISRLAGLFKEISIGMLGLTLTILVGGLLLQGGAAAVTDSLTLRTAKYLTGTFIPVIGGIFSDAVDLIVSCSLIIKNALNIFGVIAIIIIIAYPVVKLIALIFIYKLAGALIEPISNPRLVNIFNELANSLIFVFVIVMTVAFMFFIVITVIVGAANLTVMMR